MSLCRKIHLVIALLISCLFTVNIQADTVAGHVVKVTDGDTIRILTDEKQTVKVRLAGIDCPERRQPWGRRATEALKSRLNNEIVTVQVMGQDRYGRAIGRVFVEGSNINRFLVESGNCWVYPRYAKDPVLFELQNLAQSKKLGLWSLPENERIAPWDWRKR